MYARTVDSHVLFFSAGGNAPRFRTGEPFSAVFHVLVGIYPD